MKEWTGNFIAENKFLLFFMTILFLTGIIFGAIVVNGMSFIQKQDVYFQLEQYFTLMQGSSPITIKEVLQKSFFFHLKYLLTLFILGMTIIGIPLIFLLIFIKGLVVGFSVGFIVSQLGTKGLLLATVSIAPQNIITIPVYLFAAALAVHFSILLMKKLSNKNPHLSIKGPFITYGVMFILFIALGFVSSLIESFIANKAFQTFLQLNQIYFDWFFFLF